MKANLLFFAVILIFACSPPEEGRSSVSQDVKSASTQKSSPLEKEKDIVDLENIFAWCIVPFDSVGRSPQERIDMLKRLGIKKYAYDWREKHLSTMKEELTLAKENDIEVISVWLWIDDDLDSVGALSPLNEKLFSIVEETGYEGQIWMSFNSNFFENLSKDMAVKKGAKMLSYLSDRASKRACKVGLYNHGDWFGDPGNQIEIIKALPEKDLGLVYNFHHGHDQIDAFPDIAKTMTPYLWYVNLNGMKKDGPKILSIGEGDHEREMIEILQENGYKGDYGILGHVEDADVETILRANLDGLFSIQ